MLPVKCGLQVFDRALDVPVPDIRTNEALSERDCAATMAYGMEAVAQAPDLLCLGDLSVGNEVSAAALACAIIGGAPEDWTGRDKIITPMVAQALDFHGASLNEPLEALRRLGGREFAAVAGAIVAARQTRVPVLLDGFVVTAAAAVLHKLDSSALDHCLAAHRSVTPGHAQLLEAIGKEPLLDFSVSLAQGTGAALAIPLLRAACDCHAQTATLEDSKVSLSPTSP
jgi:nicotinate-nucleotide--dimethylbenzimidazole phosphoribosyltransferase